MRKIALAIMFVLIFTGLSFAEQKVYTEEDLGGYSNKPMFSEKPQPSAEKLQQDQLKEGKPENIQSEDKAKEYQIGSTNCEVLGFNASVSGTLDVPRYGGSGQLRTRQCVNATVRNLYGMVRWVKDFTLEALYINGTRETTIMIAINGSNTTQILPGETYTGYACFADITTILKLGCTILL